MIDFTNVIDIMLGQNQVTQIEDSLGNVLWSASQPVVNEYFYVEDVSGSANTLSITKDNKSAPTIEVFKSTDMSTWESMGSTSTTPITATVPANGKLYLKAVCDRWGNDNSYRSYNNIINCNGNFNVGGYLSSLVLGDNYNTNTIQNKQISTFSNLFKNNINLINTNKLILPDDVLQYCYKGMFYGCTNLTTAPALPATTLAQYCYNSMFRDCTSLTTAPALPAAPYIPQGCYKSMFSGCTSLTTSPELPATNLDADVYSWMFSDCINLNKVITYNTNYNSGKFNNWLNNVAATGDFYNLGGATYTSGASGIPSGWTEHTSL